MRAEAEISEAGTLHRRTNPVGDVKLLVATPQRQRSRAQFLSSSGFLPFFLFLFAFSFPLQVELSSSIVLNLDRSLYS
jgi:hypothetical protein